MACEVTDANGGFVFLNENEFATGRKRPRGPNVKSSSQNSQPSEIQSSAPAAALCIPIEDQALNYYSRNYVETSQALSGM